MKMDITVTGLRELEEKLNVVGPKAAVNILRSTVAGVARDMAKDIKANEVRVNKGLLRDSIGAKRRRGTPTRVEAAVVIKRQPKGTLSATRYWHFVEWGTRTIGAAPFIRPAYDAWKGKYVEYFRRHFGRVLERTMRKKGLV